MWRWYAGDVTFLPANLRILPRPRRDIPVARHHLLKRRMQRSQPCERVGVVAKVAGGEFGWAWCVLSSGAIRIHLVPRTLVCLDDEIVRVGAAIGEPQMS